MSAGEVLALQASWKRDAERNSDERDIPDPRAGHRSLRGGQPDRSVPDARAHARGGPGAAVEALSEPRRLCSSRAGPRGAERPRELHFGGRCWTQQLQSGAALAPEEPDPRGRSAVAHPDPGSALADPESEGGDADPRSLYGGS